MSLRYSMSLVFMVTAVGIGTLHLAAVTRLASADGQFWDIQDTSPWAQDSGGIATGGRANPFNGFGYLKLRVRTGGVATGPTLVANEYLHGFGLAHDGDERFDSITPVVTAGVAISRALYAPKDTNYLRYLDRYTNTTSAPRMVDVAWGGASGVFADGGMVTVASTSNGDRRIDLTDTFVTVMQNAGQVSEPARGPSGHGPSAHVLGSTVAGHLTGIGDMYANPFTDKYPGYDPAHIGYVFTLRIPPGRTLALMTFVVKGLSEVYDPRGGFPIPIRDGIVAPKFSDPYAGPDPMIPAAGSEIAKVTETARRLLSTPDLRGLTARQRGEIVNWRPETTTAASTFSVVDKTAPQIQDALSRGDVTSEDVVDEYLTRLAVLDRNGPVLRSMLALNRSALADARALDVERAAGRIRGPLHGIPVAYKDNIDVLGLPTTGGSLALLDHRPRLDSRVAAGMKKAGAVVIGKTNLDEFPFGDFGISSVAGTIGNAPGSLKAGWEAYLSRGAKSGEPVITLEQLMKSGRLAPSGARRFEAALEPAPTGEALRSATAAFYARREAFRTLFVDLMEREHLDALLYPANQARPATHEGGLARYGQEPGTCEESAMTGLPQVTVPAGFFGDKYPFGVSFLGRSWADRRLLALAYAYEQATHHRRPPRR